MVAVSIWIFSKRRRERETKEREDRERQNDSSGLKKIGAQKVCDIEVVQMNGQLGYSKMDTFKEPRQLADQHGVSELVG
jgi:hypothetical protein